MNILFNLKFFLVFSILLIIIGLSITNQASINVEVKGAVNNPGVYQIDDELTVTDLVDMAGGLKENADTSLINMSKRLYDEMVVIIYTKDEVNTSKSTSIVKYIENTCVCPAILNNACITVSIPDDIIEKNLKVSLNNGTLEELMTLSGIGEAKAKAIIEYRKISRFKALEEIMNVKGIGKSIYEKIKDNISL